MENNDNNDILTKEFNKIKTYILKHKKISAVLGIIILICIITHIIWNIYLSTHYGYFTVHRVPEMFCKIKDWDKLNSEEILLKTSKDTRYIFNLNTKKFRKFDDEYIAENGFWSIIKDNTFLLSGYILYDIKTKEKKKFKNQLDNHITRNLKDYNIFFSKDKNADTIEVCSKETLECKTIKGVKPLTHDISFDNEIFMEDIEYPYDISIFNAETNSFKKIIYNDISKIFLDDAHVLKPNKLYTHLDMFALYEIQDNKIISSKYFPMKKSIQNPRYLESIVLDKKHILFFGEEIEVGGFNILTKNTYILDIKKEKMFKFKKLPYLSTNFGFIVGRFRKFDDKRYICYSGNKIMIFHKTLKEE